MTYNVLMWTLNPTQSLTHRFNEPLPSHSFSSDFLFSVIFNFGMASVNIRNIDIHNWNSNSNVCNSRTESERRVLSCRSSVSERLTQAISWCAFLKLWTLVHHSPHATINQSYEDFSLSFSWCPPSHRPSQLLTLDYFLICVSKIDFVWLWSPSKT